MTAVLCPSDIEECPKVDEHKSRWHINRGISLENVLMMMVMGAAFVVWMSSQEGRLRSVEVAVTHLDETDKKAEERLKTERTEIRDDIKEIKAQVNKLVERRK